MNSVFGGRVATGLGFAPAKFDHSLATRFCDRSASESTRKTYRIAIGGFFRFAGNQHPALINSGDVLLWRDHLQSQKKKPATVALKVAVIRSFFEYLCINGLVPANPAASAFVKVPISKSKPSERVLTPKEISHLLAGPNINISDDARDYAILLLLLQSGLRVSEVGSLKVSAIQTEGANSTLVLRGNSGMDRIVPVSSELENAIKHYLRLDSERRRRMRSNGADAFLFQPHSNYRTLEFNRPLTSRWIEKLVGKWASYAAIGRVTPGDLRRTAVSSGQVG